MFTEALKFITDQAVKAAGPQITHPAGEPPFVYLHDGMKRYADAAPRGHIASDLSAIIQFANDHPCSVVWYSQDQVTCVVDDESRRDFVTLPLVPSAQRAEVQSWGRKSRAMKHGELILLLRTMFKRCLEAAPNLIDVLRIIKFSSSSSANSNVGPSKASIGKTIEKEVTGVDALPTEFTLQIPIFGEPFSYVRGLVCVAIEMHAVEECFTLHPVPGDVEQQVMLAEEAIGKALRDKIDEGRVFYGRFAESMAGK